VRGDQVLFLCDTTEEAYAFVRARANLNDPDERLRLARWCHGQGLRELALAEVRAAVRLDPGHAEARRLQRNLERTLTAVRTPAGGAEESEPTVELPPVELTAESLGLFVTRVQPILMNACASCHASGRGGAFKLGRAYDNGLASRRTTQGNLAAVLGQINRETPEASPLLTKAVSAHGEQLQPALKGRQAAAYKTLDDWVQLTLANNPQLRGTAREERKGTLAGAPPTPETTFASLAAPQDSEDKPMPTAPAKGDKAVKSPGSLRVTVDEFDPAIFNRQMHPRPGDMK
jgi:hypothetical protein